jgi:hypothetical protein
VAMGFSYTAAANGGNVMKKGGRKSQNDLL